MPLAEDGHVRLWAGFKSTAHEYLSFLCLLCTANVSAYSLNIASGVNPAPDVIMPAALVPMLVRLT